LEHSAQKVLENRVAGTQMALKTLHFAGVASMNIAQGVPWYFQFCAFFGIMPTLVTIDLFDGIILELRKSPMSQKQSVGERGASWQGHFL
jgi:hypothetical protein